MGYGKSFYTSTMMMGRGIGDGDQELLDLLNALGEETHHKIKARTDQE
ncbi:MAG: hypothetical protein N2260_07085 [Syntrophobacterales bacterium]|nr:hypothetical protein [Syntrophobacterales bacterium]